MYQIVQSSRTECFMGVSREGLTYELLAKHPWNILTLSILTLRIPIMCKAHASLRRMLSHEIPARNLLPSIAWVFTHSLSHTTLTIKSHNKYRVQKIEYNYNQIWHRIKANKIHICKSQLYNLPIWLFRDKTPKTDSRLKCKFGNNGKTHSHLI